MSRPALQRNRGLTAVSGVMALVIVLLIVQIWLLSATLDAFLAGHRDAAVPGAILSSAIFLACFGLYQFIVRLERKSGKRAP